MVEPVVVLAVEVVQRGFDIVQGKAPHEGAIDLRQRDRVLGKECAVLARHPVVFHGEVRESEEGIIGGQIREGDRGVDVLVLHAEGPHHGAREQRPRLRQVRPEVGGSEVLHPQAVEGHVVDRRSRPGVAVEVVELLRTRGRRIGERPCGFPGTGLARGQGHAGQGQDEHDDDRRSREECANAPGSA